MQRVGSIPPVQAGTPAVPVLSARWQFEPFSRTLSLTSEYSYIHDDARSKNSSLSDTTLCCRRARSERVPITFAPFRDRGRFE